MMWNPNNLTEIEDKYVKIREKESDNLGQSNKDYRFGFQVSTKHTRRLQPFLYQPDMLHRTRSRRWKVSSR